MLRKSILIVDDEINMLDSLSDILSLAYDVFLASSGEEALRIINNTPPSLILLDLNMHEMPGVEVLRKIRERSTDIKVIIMTGYRDWVWMMKCANLNINGYIEKPFQPKALIKKIRNTIGSADCMVLRRQWGVEYEKRFAQISPQVRTALHFISKKGYLGTSRENIADQLEISPQYLSKIFKKDTGMQLVDYIIRRKIEKTKNDFRINPNISLKDSAASVGFTDVNYFCRLFKIKTGITPTKFRKQL